MTFQLYTKIRPLGSEENAGIFENASDTIIVEEKIDGANFRFMITEDNRIIFGSRTQSIGDSEQQIGGNWEKCVEHIKKTLKGKDLSEYKGLIFYGECCIKHTLQYDWSSIPPFLGYDIFDIKDNKYLDYPVNKIIFNLLGLEFVPVIKECSAGEIGEINDSIVPPTKYPSPSAGANDLQAEGIVYKNYDKQIFGKYVLDKFKEKAREVFGGSPKFAKDDTERVVLTYCVNARIEKIIFKLIDDGHKLDMPLMHHAPVAVLNDIFEEAGKEIFMSKLTVNFGEVRQRVSKRVLEVLKNMIANNLRR